MSEHLGANLKLLCSHYRSISEVCRQLAINRAQFNKYLSGQSQPTPYNRKRIGDFFGVEDYELGLPPEQFARLLGARPSAQPRPPRLAPLLRLLQPLRAEAGDLGRYCGYYFEYANCMSVPGSILLSLVHLYEEDGVFLFERQERQERTSSTDVQAEEWARCRYLGAPVPPGRSADRRGYSPAPGGGELAAWVAGDGVRGGGSRRAVRPADDPVRGHEKSPLARRARG